MHTNKRRLDAYIVYLIFSGVSSLSFTLIVTVNLVYQVEVAKLSPLQLVLVGTALETVCFLCQVPTGVLADVYSRRLSVIVGTVLFGAAFILEGSIPRFIAIAAGQALFGIGATFVDGAQQAWITDEMGEEKVGRVFLRSTQIGLACAFFGSFISVALASIRLNLPIIVGGGLSVALSIFLVFFMPETGFRPTPKAERQSWGQMGSTLISGIRVVRRSTVLITILCIGLFYGLYSEGFDRLSTAHLLANFTFPSLGQLQPVVWFGIIAAAETLISLGVTELVKRRVDINNQKMVVRALFIINAMMIVSLLTFALAGYFYLAVIAFLGFGVFRSANEPVYMTWLTRNTESRVRATVISMRGQVDAFGQIVGGPPVGYIGSAFSLRAALVAVSVTLSPVLLLLAYASRKRKSAVIPVEAEVVEVVTPELV
ncbi:MAG: tetracycline efflux MFS transporter TetA(P) [Ktedonobacteraceae bacterium]